MNRPTDLVLLVLPVAAVGVVLAAASARFLDAWRWARNSPRG
ncbi:hypothetical protein FHU38_005220 [Saccharomonospora amisosensis]|uniref:Uncharacterized protein n=1 Tax=Saccharomonospora amisosensis TaxID=1128677 RepID=A0A7X5UVX4_9PSEU|nr:hypothetical protein [Saccharomonospora amisosensis]NIJ14812.1 hypothetical protein [Saccharomonospora amisosensis]